MKGLLNSQQPESDAYSLSWAQFPCHPGPVNDIVSLSSSIALILCKITSSLHKLSETPNSWKADQNMSVESLALSPQFTVKRLLSLRLCLMNRLFVLCSNLFKVKKTNKINCYKFVAFIFNAAVDVQ